MTIDFFGSRAQDKHPCIDLNEYPESAGLPLPPMAGQPLFTNPILGAAQIYAGNGWRVIPIPFRTKRATLKDWPNKATFDEGQIRQWFHGGPSNMAICTGQESNLVVIDVDGQDGEQALKQLQSVHGPLPQTLTSLTGKGRHLFFLWPNGADIRNSAGKIGPNVDIRANGGYVLAPPSIHPSGAQYRWDNERVSVAELPHQWVDLLAQPAQKERKEMTPQNTLPLPNGASQGVEYGRTALRDECGKVAMGTEGQRNTVFNGACLKVARVVAGGHLDAFEAETALKEAARRAGLDEREIDATFRSGFTAGLQDPRTPEPRRGNTAAPPMAGQGEAGGETDSAPPSFLPPPPPVPLDVFPHRIQEVIQDAARAFNVPASVPACAVLALTSACIGRARGVIIKEGWTPHANLYLCLVGKSGSGKSPCASAILNSVHRVDYQMHAEWKKACEEYQLEQARYLETMRQYRKGELDDPGPTPEKPKRKQIFVDDATVESLTDALADNPRGVLWLRDELAGLILDLDKYSGEKGSTKTRLMSAYDCGPWKTNRINQGRTAYVEHACLSIFGGIQPGALKDAFCDKDAATGFLPRFLFVRFELNAPPTWTDYKFGQSQKDELDRIARNLLAMDFRDDGRPQYVGVSGEAKALYIQWHDRLANEMWMGAGDDESSVLSKLRDQCLRLALLLHLSGAAQDERNELAPVSAATMDNAIRLADWFREHQRHVWSLIGHAGQKATEATPLERHVAQAIIELTGEVQDGRLIISRIAEQINSLDVTCQVTPERVGHACKKLGLRRGRTMHGRHVELDNEVISRMHTIKTVIPS